MESIKRETIIALYDIYGNLLTDKQKEYFEDYYFMDLSISEIAENHNISRNGVHDQIKRAVSALEDYESKLRLLFKINQIKNLDLSDSTLDTIIDIIKE